MASHKIVHWELMGPDAGGLAEFYNTLFGWGAQTMPGFNDYALVDPGQSGIGGGIGSGTEEMPNYLAMYVEVGSVDEHLGLVEANGGTTLVPRTVIPGTITFGLFTDPAGNVMGVVEAEVPPTE
jgi:predicted enzyme related to lactoylglutathione lyase